MKFVKKEHNLLKFIGFGSIGMFASYLAVLAFMKKDEH